MKVIIFDFDGTIADTFSTFINIINRLAPEFGYEPADAATVERLQNLSSREILKQANISAFKLPFLFRRLKAEMTRELYQLQLIDGIQEALVLLKQDGYHLGIITSNSSQNVTAFLKNRAVFKLFDFIYSGASLFGKARIINRLLRKNNWLPEDIVYVGDETRDIEAAKKTRIKIVAVTWGFNSRQVLAQQQPDFLIDSPSELVTIIQQL